MLRLLALLGLGLIPVFLIASDLMCGEVDPRAIYRIMIKAHTVAGGRGTNKALDQKVANGIASGDEKKQLADLYDALTRTKPPKGDLEEWKKDTAVLAEVARGIVRGDEQALTRLPEAANCKKCHSKYRR